MSEERREEVISKVEDVIDVLSAAVEDVDDQYRPDVERLLKVLAHGVSVLSVADVDLTSQEARDGATNQLEFYAENAREEILGGNPSNAAQYTDDVLTRLAAIRVSEDERGLHRLSETVASIQQKANGRLDDLERQVSALKEDAGRRAQEAITGVEAQLGQARDQVHESIGVIEESVRGAEETVGSLSARVEGFEAEKNDEFSESQALRDGEWQRQIGKIEAEFEALKERLSSGSNEAVENANASIAKIKSLAEEAGVVAGAIAEKGTADHYKGEANRERRSALVWRVTTIYVLLGAAAVAAYAGFGVEERGPEDLAARLAISVILSAVAYYTARQSAIHRRRERAARRTELELQAFGPFVATIDPLQQEIERVMFTRRTFGKADEDELDDGDDLPSLLNPLKWLRRRRELPDGNSPSETTDT